jgi:hypothetical protein
MRHPTPAPGNNFYRMHYHPPLAEHRRVVEMLRRADGTSFVAYPLGVPSQEPCRSCSKPRTADWGGFGWLCLDCAFESGLIPPTAG